MTKDEAEQIVVEQRPLLLGKQYFPRASGKVFRVIDVSACKHGTLDYEVYITFEGIDINSGTVEVEWTNFFVKWQED